MTAEDFYHSQAEFNKWLRDLVPHEEDHIKCMLEEYGQIYTEQARQEERERHKYIVAAMFGLIEEDWMPKETKLGMKFHLQEAGYETEGK